MIFFIPEPDDKAREKIDLIFFGRIWIFSYYIKVSSRAPPDHQLLYKKTLRGPLRQCRHIFGESENCAPAGLQLLYKKALRGPLQNWHC